ncbi:hypothetical protein BH10ACI3_BH10ACI3_24950 [soil metagenome]
MNLRKIFLYILIASVAICAVMGIGVILFGTFGEFEQKILGTTFTITCTSILGLACGAYYESKGAKALPFAGISFAMISAVMVIILIWRHSDPGDVFAKSTVTATMLAATCSLLSLISLAKLDGRFAWSRYLAIFASIALDGILLWLLWYEPQGESEIVSRTIGVLSIVIASVTVVTPVFHKLSRTTIAVNEIDAEIGELKARLEELEQRKAKLTHTVGE